MLAVAEESPTGVTYVVVYLLHPLTSAESFCVQNLAHMYTDTEARI